MALEKYIQVIKGSVTVIDRDRKRVRLTDESVVP